MGTILTNFMLVGLTKLSFQCRATRAASVYNIVTEDDPGLKDDGVDETTGVDSDFFHRQYDSPIKQKPVQHIQEQDAEIEHLNKCLKPGLTHHFSNFDAKMMPTKPNTLEHRRHGYRAMRSVARRTYTP